MGWGGRAWCVNVEGVRVSGWGDEKIPEMGGSDGCSNGNVFNATEICASKWLKFDGMYILPRF